MSLTVGLALGCGEKASSPDLKRKDSDVSRPAVGGATETRETPQAKPGEDLLASLAKPSAAPATAANLDPTPPAIDTPFLPPPNLETVPAEILSQPFTTKELLEEGRDGSRSARQVKQFADGTVVNHGRYQEWRTGGRRYCEGEYADNRRVGKWTFWYDNGVVAKMGAYKDGKPDGRWAYWRPNGVKEREEYYQDGVRDGLWMFYNDQAKPLRQEEYRGGNRHGTWTEWYPDGKKATEAHFADDRLNGQQTIWYPNGQIARSAEFKNGLRHGRFVSWDNAGQKVSDLVYRNDAVVRITDR